MMFQARFSLNYMLPTLPGYTWSPRSDQPYTKPQLEMTTDGEAATRCQKGCCINLKHLSYFGTKGHDTIHKMHPSSALQGAI